jgi:hypothetical protein
VTFNALEESIEWREGLTSPPGLELRRGGHGQTLLLASAGQAIQPLTSFNYRAQAAELGQFTMPEFAVVVYGKRVQVPAAALQVVASPPASIPPAQKIVLVVPATNVFAGQAVRVNLVFPGAPAISSLGSVPAQVTGHGLLMEQSSLRARTEVRPGPPGSGGVQTLVYEAIITPITAGRLSALAQAFVGIRLPSTAQPVTLLDSEPVELRVRPLPRSGELPGFTGAVGTFVVETLELSTNVLTVGTPAELKVRVRGEGNLARLVPPPPPRDPEWHVVPGPADNTPPQAILAQGVATLNYTLIPLTEKALATPPIPFSGFDPQRGAYVDLTIPPVPVKVKPGALPADLEALGQADATVVEPEKEPVLSDLAPSPGVTAASLAPAQNQGWFPWVQLAPGAAFFGLWGWDRRRRYLEQHPALVLHRRARRALHRERRALQRAARAGDAARFAAAAVNALRVVCAPFYPAEPRALVGSDVLALVPESERAGPTGEVVRRFFAITDAARFSAAHGDARELLALQSDLERVLEQLEARLR